LFNKKLKLLLFDDVIKFNINNKTMSGFLISNYVGKQFMLGMFGMMILADAHLKSITSNALSPIQIDNRKNEYSCGFNGFNQISPKIKSDTLMLLSNDIIINSILSEIDLAVSNSKFMSQIWEQQITSTHGKLTVLTVKASKSDDNIKVDTYITSATQNIPDVYGSDYKCRCEAKYADWLGFGPEDCSTCDDKRVLNNVEIDMIFNRLKTKAYEVQNNMIDNK
jgi:hypothetical protein